MQPTNLAKLSLIATALLLPAAAPAVALPGPGPILLPGLPAPLPVDPCSVVPPVRWSLNTGAAGWLYPGASLPAGAVDARWQLVSAPAATPPYTHAYRVNDASPWWPATGSVSKWISPAVNAQTGNAVSVALGTFTYEAKFPVLCSQRAYVDFCFAADDRVTWLLDGGTIVPAPPYPGKQYQTTLCWTSQGLLSLAPGVHTLTAKVENDLIISGLWVDGYAQL